MLESKRRYITIGDKKCYGGVCRKKTEEFYAELNVNGKTFDQSGIVHDEDEAFDLLREIVKRYQDALDEEGAFPDWVRSVFTAGVPWTKGE